jgi:hypothetical protein
LPSILFNVKSSTDFAVASWLPFAVKAFGTGVVANAATAIETATTAVHKIVFFIRAFSLA